MRKGMGLIMVAAVLVGEAVYTHCRAKDFGVQGATFKIAEESLLAVIHKRLRAVQKSGKLQTHQKEIQQRVRHSLQNPLPVEGIKEAQTNRSYLYTPSITIDQDIKDHKGNLIAAKGTTVNPLETHSFGKPLLLIQGEDQSQVNWALKQAGKVVLVSGKPLELLKTYQQTFFFDQGGILCRKFGIRQVPARISQKGKMLLIEELVVKEKHQLKTVGR